jgi:AcrR family transcriptional regulator
MYHPGIRASPQSDSEQRSLVAQHPALQPLLGASADVQRARVLEAITGVVAERGYATATVSDIVRRARVSRTTFYELYDGKESCFADACRHGFAVLEARLIQAAGAATSEEGWRGEFRSAIRTYLTTLAEEPLFARAFLVEVHAGGDASMKVVDETRERMAERFRASTARAMQDRAARIEPPDGAFVLFAAGADALAASHVRAGRVSSLGELEPILVYAAEALALGPEPMTVD